MISRIIAVSAISLLLATAAVAQNQPKPHGPPFNGVVEKLDGLNLMVKTDAGKEVAVTLAATTPVTRSRMGTGADLKSGQYVHSMTVDGADGKLVAQQVVVLPDATRATGGEGHMAQPNNPKASMTNGNVDAVMAGAGGHVMKVGYKGGQSEVNVPKDAKVTITEASSVDALKPGTKVMVIADEVSPGVRPAIYVSITQ